MPSSKKQVKVTLPSDMVTLLQSRYGNVNADTVRQAIADLFAIENDVQHGGARKGAGRPSLYVQRISNINRAYYGARKGAGRPSLYDLECQECGHKWRETLPTLGCPKCDSEQFWTA